MNLSEFTDLYNKVALTESSFVLDVESKDNYFYGCPMCDGEGAVDAELYDHKDKPYGFQVFGVGEEMEQGEEFFKALWKFLPELTRLAKIGQETENRIFGNIPF